MEVHKLARKGDVISIKKLFKKGVTVDSRDAYDRTCLHIACETGNLELCEFLLKKGASHDSEDKTGWKPIHTASNYAQYPVVLLLLNHEADPNAINSEKTTPISYIVRQPWSSDTHEVLDVLVQVGADVNARNAFLDTALHAAASKGRIEAMDFLIQHNADVNIQNKFGETAMHKAARSNINAVEMTELLIEAGAKMLRGNEGTAYDYAVDCCNTSLINLFSNLLGESVMEELKAVKASPATEPMPSIVLPKSLSNKSLGSLVPKSGSNKNIPRSTSNKSVGGMYRSASTKSIGDESLDLIEEEEGEGSASWEGSTSLRGSRARKNSDTDSRADIESSANFCDNYSEVDIPANTVHSPLVKFHSEFNLETGDPDYLALEYPFSSFLEHFKTCEHVNYIGYAKSGAMQEPVIVSCLKNPLEVNYLAVLWTRKGQVPVYIPVAAVVANSSSKHFWATSKQFQAGIAKALRDTLPPVMLQFGSSSADEKSSKPSRLSMSLSMKELSNRPRVELNEPKSDADCLGLRNQLIDFDSKNPQGPTRLSIGVLLSKEGQNTEEQLFSNRQGSPEYEEFLEFLGHKIELKGWTGPRADLDTKTNTTGTHSLFTVWNSEPHSFEIMFHVSTMLPYDDTGLEQLSRKRRIGNDTTCIIFQEGGTFVCPIRSKFLHVYFVISPLKIQGRTHYRLSVIQKKCVNAFGPILHHSAIFERNEFFREFLFTKLVNGQIAALNSPEIAEKIYWKPKEAFLQSLCKQYLGDSKSTMTIPLDL
eukprot:TRINITY_DN5738_c0_g1_i1.p1 TRINITY_DN5738_c0_g1~~TRINITY_DN5738_c0_g1_i1.p1  ORF type:complete len:764 (-),score=163.79 TRINITY_DN5738_c0_g1_i1:67-2358(-)